MRNEERTLLLIKCRRTLLRRTSSLARTHGSGGKLRLALRHPLFPLSYVLRNIVLLDRESSWHRLSPRRKGKALRQLLEQRAHFFMVVRDWLGKSNGDQTVSSRSPRSNRAGLDSYCIHCGGCCETASGFPDFPRGSPIPEEWKALFGTGLGEGHRFCPFLWEQAGTGMSLCAIHPWRAEACRTFDEDDCRFVLEDPDLHCVTDPERTRTACKNLLRMLRN